MESIGQFANLPCGSISNHGVYKTCIMKVQNCLWPVDADHGGLVFLCAGLADESDQFVEDFSGEVAAAPVKGENFSLLAAWRERLYKKTN